MRSLFHKCVFDWSCCLQVLDGGLKLETRQLGSLIEQINPSYANPTPSFDTTYLDDEMRISRDQDGKLFVYSRVSSSTEATAYEDKPSDFGIGQILEGMMGSFGGS